MGQTSSAKGVEQRGSAPAELPAEALIADEVLALRYSADLIGLFHQARRPDGVLADIHLLDDECTATVTQHAQPDQSAACYTVAYQNCEDFNTPDCEWRIVQTQGFSVTYAQNYLYYFYPVASDDVRGGNYYRLDASWQQEILTENGWQPDEDNTTLPIVPGAAVNFLWGGGRNGE